MNNQTKRNQFPFAAKMGDELRKYFPNAKVSYAEENGNTTGKELKTVILTTANGINRCKEEI